MYLNTYHVINLPCLPPPDVVCSSCDAPLASSPQTADFSVQIDLSTLAAQTQGQVTLRRDKNNSRTPHRPRPSSMVDYQSYRHTQQLVRTILEQPAAQGLAPEVQELVDSIRNVLRSDQEHMEEAVRCASYIEQVWAVLKTYSMWTKGQHCAMNIWFLCPGVYRIRDEFHSS